MLRLLRHSLTLFLSLCVKFHLQDNPLFLPLKLIAFGFVILFVLDRIFDIVPSPVRRPLPLPILFRSSRNIFATVKLLCSKVFLAFPG